MKVWNTFFTVVPLLAFWISLVTENKHFLLDCKTVLTEDLQHNILIFLILTVTYFLPSQPLPPNPKDCNKKYNYFKNQTLMKGPRYNKYINFKKLQDTHNILFIQVTSNEELISINNNPYCHWFYLYSAWEINGSNSQQYSHKVHD